nr:hypothetical protein [uncultured Caproiciproducens sp.]
MRKSVIFTALAFIGFAGMFFVAGASDADRISLDQLVYLCAGSAACMAIGLVGYIFGEGET